jgi:membrane protein DedA with SNARE-associated domain
VSETFDFLIRHGYAVLAIAVLAEQIGAPIPALPILLAAGALTGTAGFDLPVALAVSVAGALTGDLAWFEIGRRRGSRVLNLLCRISLEPDSCVRRTEEVFARHGAPALLWAKFLPGLSLVAPPLAGIFQMRLWRFVGYDALGAALWAGSFLALGRLFDDEIELLAVRLARSGGWLAAMALGGLALWLAFRLVQRRRFLARIRIDRISPEELKARLDAGEEVAIVDLRHDLDFAADPQTLPGALRLNADALADGRQQPPPGREVVLYCT